MLLAGVKVPSHHVVLLAGSLESEEPLAVKLRLAVEHKQTIVALSQHERERLLAIVQDAPPIFADLKAALREQARRRANSATLDQQLRREAGRRRRRSRAQP